MSRKEDLFRTQNEPEGGRMTQSEAGQIRNGRRQGHGIGQAVAERLVPVYR
jgi:hypothetical protein